MSRWVPAVVAFAITIAVLLPATRQLDQHIDEMSYAWKAAYFGGLVSRVDLQHMGTDPVGDPGWNPSSYWAVEQPFSTAFLYSIAMGITGTPAPEIPFWWPPDNPEINRMRVPEQTLPVLRLTAVVAAALGFAFIAARLQWWGPLVPILVLAIPHTRSDLARAWAEGPVILGIGLVALAFGTRWLPVVAGFAATFKLTLLGAWPFAVWRGTNGGMRPLLAIAATYLTWLVFTPPAVLGLAPGHLAKMIGVRIALYLEQSSAMRQNSDPMLAPWYDGVGGALGLFIPSRYLVVPEVLAVLALVLVFRHLSMRIRSATATTPPPAVIRSRR